MQLRKGVGVNPKNIEGNTGSKKKKISIIKINIFPIFLPF